MIFFEAKGFLLKKRQEWEKQEKEIKEKEKQENIPRVIIDREALRPSSNKD